MLYFLYNISDQYEPIVYVKYYFFSNESFGGFQAIFWF